MTSTPESFLDLPRPNVFNLACEGGVTSLLAASFSTGCGRSKVSRPGESFDAGPVFPARSPRFSHRFLVKNTTGRAVTITDKIPSCTCSSVALDRMTLAPGGETYLTVARPGSVVRAARRISVHSPRISLWMPPRPAATSSVLARPLSRAALNRMRWARVSVQRLRPEASRRAFVNPGQPALGFSLSQPVESGRSLACQAS